MLLKYFYDTALAHASYLVGCQRANTAIVVDPGRDIDQYLQFASAEGMRIVAVAETHIHADYVSGARELAERVGAKLYVSDEGPSDWKYQFTNDYDAQLLKNGDSFAIGNLKFDVLHTPGHTPESISFLLTDEGGGADKPMGIFTGDFVFVGSIGRPDLLEEAAGVVGSADLGARQLYQSVERFKSLPDYMQVWPAHGAGSACGKGLGAIPSSTVGYEKQFNPALQFSDEEEFVSYILADQPDAPTYFAVMKRVNKEGPKVLGATSLPNKIPVDQIQLPPQVTLLDVSDPEDFAKSHVSGSVNIPLDMLAGWAGWLLDYSVTVRLIGDVTQMREAIRVLHKIGINEVEGYYDIGELRDAGLASGSYVSAAPKELAARIVTGEVRLVDVRSDAEWRSGHIPGASHVFLGRIADNLDLLGDGKPVVTQCQSGKRSAIAASILQARGFDVINMTGGYSSWQACDLPTVSPESESDGFTNACSVANGSSCSI